MIRPADLPDGRLEDELRAALASATEDLPPTRDPWARTMRAVERSRTRRRAGALAAMVVAAIAVAGAVLPLRGAGPAPANPEPQPTVTSTDVTTWPTRGNLADREDLIAEVRQAVLESEGTVWSVPFLGDVGGRRVAFVVTDGEDSGVIHDLVVLTGAPTAPVRTWQRQREGLPSYRTSAVTAAIRLEDGVVQLVAVTLSAGVRVDVSSRPLIDPQGTVRRQFSEVALVDGVGTAHWSGTSSSLVVRVRAGDSPATLDLPMVLGTTGEEQAAQPSRQAVPDSCAGPTFGNLRLNLLNAAADAAREAGYQPADVDEVRVAWCLATGPYSVMVVGVTLADGTALQASLQNKTEGDTTASSTRRGHPVPRGRAGTYPSYLTLFDDYKAPEASGATVLLSAPGGASAELVRTSAGGTVVVARARLNQDGVGVTKATAGLGDLEDPTDRLSVVVRDRAGREIERVDGPKSDPWLTRSPGQD